MNHLKHIFFDLDHTLWDFDKNCFETLRELYELHQMHSFNSFSCNDFFEVYTEINESLWKDYNAGTITKEIIRDKRFILTFNKLGLSEKFVPEKINEQFLSICPAKGNVFPFALEVLEYLKNKYQLHIITNGFKETQHIKLETSGLSKYFPIVINSEICGFKKPDVKIFDYAFKVTSATNSDSIMIGDDWDADITGAMNAGMPYIWFNPKQRSNSFVPENEITCLSELYKVL
ncbi:YjjG family noncanonical pyrimidine nucleotidase [Sporocytophaga myxococcoides]|uniref:YjjG family noncanonical pyrimidine nucleotidase n=1 Tax=Sporocytophaga myxococcoides TaxID=153721 RepID=UPI00048EA5AB|nr:YjjG family noncanonical pyrimidine nucleotidase [Sporocytophaga myxococcoides]